MNICIFSFLFHDCRKKYTPPNIPINMIYQYFTKNSLMAITKSVGAGKSAPKFSKTLLNAGMTKIMIKATTTNATTITATGYINADLIFDLMASVFSM